MQLPPSPSNPSPMTGFWIVQPEEIVNEFYSYETTVPITDLKAHVPQIVDAYHVGLFSSKTDPEAVKRLAEIAADGGQVTEIT